MSREIFEIVQTMNRRNIETQLIMQCAPVIAGLKTSNLLIVHEHCDAILRRITTGSQISFARLAVIGNRVTYLVFRKSMLNTYLSDKNIISFLAECGYSSFGTTNVIAEFSERYRMYAKGVSEFPHEMGVMLGYPIEDIRGFVENNGKEFVHCGYWKVYSDKDNKVRLFKKFEDVRDSMIYMISNKIDVKTIIEIYEDAARVAI